MNDMAGKASIYHDQARSIRSRIKRKIPLLYFACGMVSFNGRWPRYGDFFLMWPLAVACILVCPFIKQEEKFTMNALHDLLYLLGQWSKVLEGAVVTHESVLPWRLGSLIISPSGNPYCDPLRAPA